MSISTNSRELSRLRGKCLYSFLYIVNHQLGRSFVSLDLQVNLLIDPSSFLFTAPRRQIVPILRFLRGLTENQFRDIFDLYQLVSLYQSREILIRGIYSELSETEALHSLLVNSDFLALVFSGTPFTRIPSYYAQFESDPLGDSFEMYLSLA